MEAPAKIKVALVDDHALFRGGLRGLLAGGGACEVVAEAADGQEFLSLLDAGLAPDVVLLDIDMPVMGGFEVAQRMAAGHPDVRIVVLTMHSDEEYYLRMVSLGARGFLLKNSDIDEVLSAIRTVARGGTYFSQELLTSLIAVHTAPPAPGPDDTLSERELEVLGLICRGMSNNEIADQLFISKRTVDKHRANILEKTGTKNTAHLVMYAVKNGLVEL
ncbi:MAG: response regulator transcription factor [Rikenellaceae bacterium]|jgi:DNA-binding NarL/FixJ family response regulator|nr:response regulator transcription factor [Rikenellaceae bacterium]